MRNDYLRIFDICKNNDDKLMEHLYDMQYSFKFYKIENQKKFLNIIKSLLDNGISLDDIVHIGLLNLFRDMFRIFLLLYKENKTSLIQHHKNIDEIDQESKKQIRLIINKKLGFYNNKYVRKKLEELVKKLN